MRIWVVIVALALGPACKKEEASQGSASPTAAAPVPAGPAKGTPAAALPPPPTPPSDFQKMRDERRAAIARLVAEIPRESAGAATPEAAARAFVAAAAQGDDVGMKRLVASLADLEAMVGPEKLPRAKEQVAAVLYKARRRPPDKLEAVAFEPGELKTIKAGEKGFKTDVTVMMRSRLVVDRGGKPGKLRFKAIVKIGNKWKVAEL